MKKLFLTVISIASFLIVSLLFPNSASSNNEYSGELIYESKGGLPTSALCPENSAVIGVTVDKAGQEDIADDFRIECLPNPMPQTGSTFTGSTRIFIKSGLATGNTVSTFCPPGSYAIGLAANVEKYVRDVMPICGQYPSGTKTYTPTKSSKFSSLNRTTLCPIVTGIQTFLTGVSGYGAAGVDGIRAVCSKPFQDVNVVPEGSILLAQYLPKGTLNSNSLLAPTNTTAYASFGSLVQVGGNGSSNSDVFPFKTSTITSLDINHYFEFKVTPATNKIIRITKISFSSLSYPIGGDITSPAATTTTLKFTSSDYWQGFSLNQQSGLREFIWELPDLNNYPSIKTQTGIQIGFVGAKGNAYNDLSGREGGTGLKIYGTVIDDVPAKVDPVVEKKQPEMPTNFTSSIQDGKLKISVDLQANYQTLNAFNVFLLAPDLGYTTAKKLEAVISGSKALFELLIPSTLSGKTIPVQVWSTSDAIDSTHILKNVTLPKLTLPTPKASPKVTPQATAKPKVKTKVTPTKKSVIPVTVKCSKAGMNRTFTGKACPPGWVKK